MTRPPIALPDDTTASLTEEDLEESFLLGYLTGAFGMPGPASYYAVELLPYLANDIFDVEEDE